MAQFQPLQNSFVAGELTPRLEARVDLPQHAQSMRIAENGVVLPHGGFTSRSGSAFVAEVKTGTLFTRLVPFEFNVEQAYICEFGNLYARFFLNQGQLESAPSTPFEIVTPFATADLADIRWAQSNDVLFMTTPNVHPYQLNRTSPTTFTITRVAFTIPPLRPRNVDDTMTVAISSSGTVATAVGFTFDEVGDVGRVLMVVTEETIPASPPEDFAVVKHNYYDITAVAVGGVTATLTKSKVVDRTGINGDAPEDTIAATDNFALGLFSDTEGAREVSFHEGRLVWASTVNQPDRFVMSVSDDFLNYSLESPDLQDAGNADRAISRRAVGGKQSSIRWVASTDQRFFVGTSGQEFAVNGANEDLVTPTGTVVKPITRRGAAGPAPVIVDSQVIFVSARKLREIVFEEKTFGFRARDITILAEHILDAGIKEIVYQQDPDSIIWIIRNDGVMVALTFEREQDMVGATRCTFNGEVESAAVIPTPDLQEDQVWMVVKRTIDGVETRYVEYIDKTYRPGITVKSTEAERIAAVAEGRFVDSFLTYSGVPADVLSGFDHLEGETVSVLADGAVHPDVVVTGGSITLNREVEAAVVGLGFVAAGMTQRILPVETNKGTGLGRTGRIQRIGAMLMNTLGMRLGHHPDRQLDQVVFRTGDDPMTSSPPLIHTDFIEIAAPEGGWTKNPLIYFEQRQPLPLTVLAIGPVAEVENRD